MNYIELVNAFWDKRAVYPLTSCEADFYMYLLKECNSRKWINPFKLPTQIIERDLNLNRRSICEIRNKLQLNGYISFIPSTKRGEIAEYEIIDISIDPFANANRTQTERKPNANRTQSVTQTEHFFKKEKETKKEISSKEDKKKDELSLFGGDESLRKYDGYTLDYVAEDFYPIFIEWLEYKKGRRERYKDDKQVMKAYHRLYNLSEGNAVYAKAIIDSSIVNSYQGFFALKPYEKENLKRNINGTGYDQRGAMPAPSPEQADTYYDEEDDTV